MTESVRRGGRVLPPESDAAARDEPDVDVEATGAVLPRPVPSGDGVELVACPACGSSNAARRVRCGRCGTALHATAEPSDPDRDRSVAEDGHDWLLVPATTPAPDHAAPQRRRRGAALAVITFGVVLGTGLGLAAGMGVGPFARDDTVVFDPMAYPDEPVMWRPATAAASSTADGPDDRSFDPTQTVDDDLATAWRADGETDGALLRHGFVAPVWVSRIEVATGDQLDDATFTSVGRVTEARIDLGTLQVEATLSGADGVQILRLPRPVLTDEVTWEATEVTGQPAAISEVRYIGWAADDDDQEAYEAP